MSRRQILVVVALSFVVLLASVVGTAAYLAQTKSQTDLICHRQDQVINSLRIIVSEHRQTLLQAGLTPSPELLASNRQLRAVVEHIARSPCVE